ncbi:MAG: type II toxin-antitoxin system RelE/ParE family toxin [Thermoanaerobaculia bacterium]
MPARRVFETRHFSRWMRKSGLTQEALCLAISEMEKGLIDAELGGGALQEICHEH